MTSSIPNNAAATALRSLLDFGNSLLSELLRFRANLPRDFLRSITLPAPPPPSTSSQLNPVQIPSPSPDLPFPLWDFEYLRAPDDRERELRERPNEWSAERAWWTAHGEQLVGFVLLLAAALKLYRALRQTIEGLRRGLFLGSSLEGVVGGDEGDEMQSLLLQRLLIAAYRHWCRTSGPGSGEALGEILTSDFDDLCQLCRTTGSGSGEPEAHKGSVVGQATGKKVGSNVGAGSSSASSDTDAFLWSPFPRECFDIEKLGLVLGLDSGSGSGLGSGLGSEGSGLDIGGAETAAFLSLPCVIAPTDTRSLEQLFSRFAPPPDVTWMAIQALLRKQAAAVDSSPAASSTFDPASSVLLSSSSSSALPTPTFSSFPSTQAPSQAGATGAGGAAGAAASGTPPWQHFPAANSALALHLSPTSALHVAQALVQVLPGVQQAVGRAMGRLKQQGAAGWEEELRGGKHVGSGVGLSVLRSAREILSLIRHTAALLRWLLQHRASLALHLSLPIILTTHRLARSAQQHAHTRARTAAAAGLSSPGWSEASQVAAEVAADLLLPEVTGGVAVGSPPPIPPPADHDPLFTLLLSFAELQSEAATCLSAIIARREDSWHRLRQAACARLDGLARLFVAGQGVEGEGRGAAGSGGRGGVESGSRGGDRRGVGDGGEAMAGMGWKDGADGSIGEWFQRLSWQVSHWQHPDAPSTPASLQQLSLALADAASLHHIQSHPLAGQSLHATCRLLQDMALVQAIRADHLAALAAAAEPGFLWALLPSLLPWLQARVRLQPECLGQMGCLLVLIRSGVDGTAVSLSVASGGARKHTHAGARTSADGSGGGGESGARAGRASTAVRQREGLVALDWALRRAEEERVMRAVEVVGVMTRERRLVLLQLAKEMRGGGQCREQEEEEVVVGGEQRRQVRKTGGGGGEGEAAVAALVGKAARSAVAMGRHVLAAYGRAEVGLTQPVAGEVGGGGHVGGGQGSGSTASRGGVGGGGKASVLKAGAAAGEPVSVGGRAAATASSSVKRGPALVNSGSSEDLGDFNGMVTGVARALAEVGQVRLVRGLVRMAACAATGCETPAAARTVECLLASLHPHTSSRAHTAARNAEHLSPSARPIRLKPPAMASALAARQVLSGLSFSSAVRGTELATRSLPAVPQLAAPRGLGVTALFSSRKAAVPVKSIPATKLRTEDGIFGTSGGFGLTKANELFVGRVAMLGFAASLLGEAITGVGILSQLNIETGIPITETEPLLLFFIAFTVLGAIGGLGDRGRFVDDEPVGPPVKPGGIKAALGLKEDGPLFGFTKANELFVGRLAQLGFAASLIGEVITGKGSLAQLNFEIGVPVWELEPLLLASIAFFFVAAINPGTGKFINDDE
ncbi:unnamed protein product [Closterium sp. Yama58-4]|nr:unnamed protein product [Closterium sp. Yama58-4]